MDAPRTRTPRRIAAITLVATLALLTLGGTVHATGSSLACPDWPTCYGSWMPAMVGGVVYEHGHRVLGALVGALALALALAAWGDAELGRPALLLAAAVAVQGGLGGLTVLLGISPWVSLVHLALAHGLCAGLVWILLGGSRRGKVPARPTDVALADLALAVVSGQVVLGGAVRHLGAGLACGEDVMRCAGRWFPTWGLGALQMTHRAAALIVLALVVAVARRWASAGGALRPWALAALALTFTQIALGLASVATSLAVIPVVAHLLCAALLFLSLVVIRMRLESDRVPSAQARMVAAT